MKTLLHLYLSYKFYCVLSSWICYDVYFLYKLVNIFCWLDLFS